MLIGASVDDNLFQVPDLADHLDQMQATGANYVRNTMSERPVHGYEVSAFEKQGDTYDLRQWNQEYWDRFSNLLKWSAERNIIVQIEIWATHDFFTEGIWGNNPWNPGNNVNYDFENTKLTKQAPQRADQFHPFFNSVPKALNDTVLLLWQQRFVDRILSHTLDYPNVLYCITNEIQHAQSKYWGWYWADYIHGKAEEKGRQVYVTEMYWAPDLEDDQHRLSLEKPGHYDFFESSQNSAVSGQENWDNLQFIREQLKDHPRPINAVKIYGKSGEVTWPGSDGEAVDRFWRNLLGGCASSRFHRNEHGKYGLGWSELSVHSIETAELFLEQVDPWNALPANELLIDRYPNEAYMMAEPGKTYAVYFPDGGSVSLDLSQYEHSFRLRWIHVAEGSIYTDSVIRGGGIIVLHPPDSQVKWLGILAR
jgi:hypothetical protein